MEQKFIFFFVFYIIRKIEDEIILLPGSLGSFSE